MQRQKYINTQTQRHRKMQIQKPRAETRKDSESNDAVTYRCRRKDAKIYRRKHAHTQNRRDEVDSPTRILKLGISDSGCRTRILRLGISDSNSRIRTLGFGIWDLNSQTRKSRTRTRNFRTRTFSIGLSHLNSKTRTLRLSLSDSHS